MSKSKTQSKSERRIEMEKMLVRVEFLALELKKRQILKPKEVLNLEALIPIDELVSGINKHYYRAVQLTQILKDTAQRVEKQEEDVSVLQELEKIFTEGHNEFDIEIGSKTGLEYVAGVIKKRQVNTLEEFLWKSLHGNLYFFSVEMSSPEKAGFICFTHGERAIERIRSICTKVGARIIRYDNKTEEKKDDSLLQVSSDLSQITRVYQINTETFISEITTISREISNWKYHLVREIEIEAAKEKLEIDKKNAYFIAQGFILSRNEERFGKIIKRICETHDEDVAAEILPIPENMTRPTHFDSNAITAGYQELTNVYGIPEYKEINPTIFSITTFPFLFGAMFGDIGHGIILMCIALYMIVKERTMRVPSFLEIVFAGRYLIFFMGVWSIYFGFLYMDFIGCPIGKSLSAYTQVSEKSLEKTGVCFFGIDYAWNVSHKSGAIFINSLKMKTSIIIGFVHISLGMILSGLNAHYKKNWTRLCGVIIPQIIIFTGIVGYMAFLIIFKWVNPSSTWPNIITVIIEMASFGSVSKENHVFVGQEAVQKGILILIFACVPWMLFFSPIYKTVKKTAQGEGALDLWMHSIIEGVEFLMGLISNISSYLRLWAVSLAHSELSSILYSKTIGEKDYKLIFLFIFCIPIWAIGTTIILICLEGLSSTLHSLRLHWVEFGSKFYAGGGTLFQPFTLRPKVLLNPERTPGGAI